MHPFKPIVQQCGIFPSPLTFSFVFLASSFSIIFSITSSADCTTVLTLSPCQFLWVILMPWRTTTFSILSSMASSSRLYLLLQAWMHAFEVTQPHRFSTALPPFKIFCSAPVENFLADCFEILFYLCCRPSWASQSVLSKLLLPPPFCLLTHHWGGRTLSLRFPTF